MRAQRRAAPSPPNGGYNHSMPSPLARLIVVAGFALGCVSSRKLVGPADAGGSDAGPVPTDAPVDTDDRDVGPLTDASIPDASDAPADGPSSLLVHFVFTNSTDHTIYIQLFGWSGQAYWSLVEGSKRLPVDNTCETCDCSRCSSCAVCGRGIARVKELAPGAQHDWTWDRRIWEPVPDGCRVGLACEQDSVIAAGAALAATVTYSATFAVDTTFGADDELIGTPLTASATFTNGPGLTIAITATQ